MDVIASDERALKRFREIHSDGFSHGTKTPVDDELVVDMVVGARQRIRDFGKYNCNLTGEMVENSGGIQIVRISKSLNIPMRPDLQPLPPD